jgi:signal transduction histidine kinase
MLRYARAGQRSTTLERVDVGALVHQVVEGLAPPADARIKVAPNLPVILTERAPLAQVFSNLIGNALKYAGKTDPHISVRCSDEGSYWKFSVRDDGPGIEPQFQERVFGIFQTLNPRDRVEATGIGLAVVRKIVDARGGHAGVDSKPGRGSTFRFTWPTHELPAVPVRSTVPAARTA